MRIPEKSIVNKIEGTIPNLMQRPANRLLMDKIPRFKNKKISPCRNPKSYAKHILCVRDSKQDTFITKDYNISNNICQNNLGLIDIAEKSNTRLNEGYEGGNGMKGKTDHLKSGLFQGGKNRQKT